MHKISSWRDHVVYQIQNPWCQKRFEFLLIILVATHFLSAPHLQSFQFNQGQKVDHKTKRTQNNRERAVGRKLRGSRFLQRRPGASREPSQKAAARVFQKRCLRCEDAFLVSRFQTFGAPQLVARFQIFNASLRNLQISSKSFSIIFGSI